MVYSKINFLITFSIIIVFCDTKESKGLKVSKLKFRSNGLITSVAPKETNTLKATRYKRQINVSTDHEAALKDLLLRFKENTLITANVMDKKYPKESKIIKYVITPLPPVKKVKSSTEMIFNRTKLNAPDQNVSETIPLKTKGNNITNLSEIKDRLLAKLKIVKDKISRLIYEKQNNTLTSNTSISEVNATLKEILKPTNNIASSIAPNLDSRISYLNTVMKSKVVTPQLGIINGIPKRIYPKEISSSTSASSRFENKMKLQNEEAEGKILDHTNSILNSLERGQNAINGTKVGILSLKDDSRNPVTSSNTKNYINEVVKPNDSKVIEIGIVSQTIFTGAKVVHETPKTNTNKSNVAIAATKNEILQKKLQPLLTDHKSTATASPKYDKLNYVDDLTFSTTTKTVDPKEFKPNDNRRRFKTVPVKIRVAEEKSQDQNVKNYDKLDAWVNDLQMALEKLLGKAPSSTFKPPYVPINEVSELSAVKSLRALSKDGLMFNYYGSDKH